MLDLRMLKVTALQISIIGACGTLPLNIYTVKASPLISQAGTNTTSAAQSKKIDINTAPIAELDKLELPGTKPSLSERIQGGRPYKTTEDMVSKKVISQAEYKLIKNLVTVGKKK